MKKFNFFQNVISYIFSIFSFNAYSESQKTVEQGDDLKTQVMI